MTVTAIRPIPTTVAHTLHQILDAAAAARPAAPAVRDPGGRWTYGELDLFSHAVARWMYEQGVRHGDRVLVRLPNTRLVLPLLYGLSRLGAVFVPINPGMKDFHLDAVVADAAPVLAVVADGAAPIRGVPTSSVAEVWAGITADPAPPEVGAVTADDLAVFIYTSGSTAAPKAVMLPQAPMAYAATAIQAVLGYRADDVVFCRVPLSFDYGLYQVLLCAIAGAELVLAADEPEFKLLTQLRDAGATIFPAVPSLAAAVVKLAGRDPGPTRLRMVTNTGAALPQAVIDGLRERLPGTRVVRMYGTTECKRITIMPPDEEFERPDSVGPALPGTAVTIVDADGREVPTGQTGEIVVTGPHVMAGYWNLPELTARTFRRTGDGVRLHTGDYGHVDADGYLYFAGRRDDMFKRKGTRMSSIEIEAAALDIPGVRAAAVLPPTDRRDLAVIVAADGLAPTAVLRQLASRLEAAKVPSICRVVADFPLTLNGKSAKQQLVALLDEATPWREGTP